MAPIKIGITYVGHIHENIKTHSYYRNHHVSSSINAQLCVADHRPDDDLMVGLDAMSKREL